MRPRTVVGMAGDSVYDEPLDFGSTAESPVDAEAVRKRREAPSAWRALSGNPLRFLVSSWPWRSLAYLLTTPLVAIVGWGFAWQLFFVVPWLAIPLGAVERRRLRWVDPAPAPSPHRPMVEPGFPAWAKTRIRERVTWRELGYGVLLTVPLWIIDLAFAVIPLGFILGLLGAPGWVRFELDGALPLPLGLAIEMGIEAYLAVAAGLVIALAAAYLITAYASARVALARAILVPPRDEDLDARLGELARSRARIVDAFENERRRVERDLHDGTQQRLTGLVMKLGLTKLELADGPPAARDLVASAHEEAKQTLDELRDLVRGIYPPVLTDRGLAIAVGQVAERCTIPVDVDIDVAPRPATPVESAAYFVACEALGNVAKHSGARRASVFARRRGEHLVLEVRDDGVGGAAPERGTGLVGLADRVSVLEGAMTMESPPGGPTVLRAEIPCAS